MLIFIVSCSDGAGFETRLRGLGTPQQWKYIEISPTSRSMNSIVRRTCSLSLISHVYPNALKPCSRKLFTNALFAAWSMSKHIDIAPNSANWIAISRPTPRLAPTITETAPETTFNRGGQMKANSDLSIDFARKNKKYEMSQAKMKIAYDLRKIEIGLVFHRTLSQPFSCSWNNLRKKSFINSSNCCKNLLLYFALPYCTAVWRLLYTVMLCCLYYNDYVNYVSFTSSKIRYFCIKLNYYQT